MIERLLTTLQRLASAERERPGQLAALGGDYADALRLVIDCPQIHLEPEQREALERVEDAIDRGEAPRRVAELARDALGRVGDENDRPFREPGRIR